MQPNAMSRAAFSARVFAVYVVAVGAVLLLVPNLLLRLFGIAPTAEIWIRVAGLIAFNLGIYVWVAAHYRPFLQASIYTRSLVFVVLTGFALSGMADPMLALFGVVDLAGAVWTWLALRADARVAGPLAVAGIGAVR
ncbi:hypothetical protein [Pseudoduganella chitinolytica]|uniref:Uncharacterized protein n=1 Tax=Pseudoduganella chitinolytica TaxID=34070 RepID=A0ABY8BE23_9BURK|nr:hypothetical protein [Pseudoduganella chitinolytica]WEF34090.1 hypothetical protein PX653_04775 [Pseudoduganella chitinolytica]